MSTQSFSEMQAKVGTLIREILFLTEGTLCIFIIKDQEGFYRIAKSGKLLEDFQPKVTTYYSQAKLLLDFVKIFIIIQLPLLLCFPFFFSDLFFHLIEKFRRKKISKRYL